MYFNLTLIIEDALYHFAIKKNEKIVLDSSGKSNIRVPELGEQKICIEFNKHLVLKTFSAKSIIRRKSELLYSNQKKILDIGKKAALLIDEINDAPAKFEVRIPLKGSITVGRENDNNICINDKYVSSYHFIIHSDNYLMTIEDIGSRNGTFVNGKVINRRKLTVGDTIDIIHSSFFVSDKKTLIIKCAIHTNQSPVVKLLPSTEESLNYEDDETISRFNDLNYENDETISRFSDLNYENDETVSRFSDLNYENDETVSRFSALNYENDETISKYSNHKNDFEEPSFKKEEDGYEDEETISKYIKV